MICESDQLKTVLELYDMDIHQKISMSNYQKAFFSASLNVDQSRSLGQASFSH